MYRGRKRQRTVGPKRPLDKIIQSINLATIGTTQRSVTLYAPNSPCTVMGLRWQLAFGSGTTNNNNIYWVIVRVQQGNALSTIATTNATTMYAPEREVIAFGCTSVLDSDAGTGTGVWTMEGMSKGMRKLQVGDTIVFAILGTTGTDSTVNGVIQFFAKC